MQCPKVLKKLTTISGLAQFLKLLGKKEKATFLASSFLFLASLLFLAVNFYFKNTKLLPGSGGIFAEGVVGQPRFINPIYAQASDIDRDIAELLFSGLMKYDSQGNITPDLAESYEIKEEGRVYDIRLKENLFWSDGQPLTVQDIVFTIKTIQNSDYKSPLQVLWLGVEVEKISENSISFALRNPYGPFLENLTQKIIPEHIFKDIAPENFPLTHYNLNPVGSGPYKFKSLNQDWQGRILSLTLEKNPWYFGAEPLLSQIVFKFYNKEEELFKSYQRGEIQGFSPDSKADIERYRLMGFQEHSFLMPRYFAAFFNPEKAKALQDIKVRQAFNYGTNKEEILNKILNNRGNIVESPVLPDIYGLSIPAANYGEFDEQKAGQLLQEAGFEPNDETGLRQKTIFRTAAFQFTADLRQGNKGQETQELQKCLAKDPEVYPQGEITGYFGEQTKAAVIRFQEKYKKEILEPWGFESGTGLVSRATRSKLNELCFPRDAETQTLKFSLSTLNIPELVQTAQLLKEQWRKLGAEIEIITFERQQIEKDVIKPRNYEILLFGQALTMVPDPFAFWHSSQTKDPGLNLADLKLKEVDQLLEENRQAMTQEQRKEKLEILQTALLESAPAVFLYNPDYIYLLSPEIKGLKGGVILDPSKRFVNIAKWYIKTKRVWNL